MKLQVTALQNNQRALDNKLVKAISVPGNAIASEIDKSTLESKSVQKEVKRLLKKNNLTLDDILKKYREIYEGKLAGTKVSDIVKVLENLTKLHNIGTQEQATDELTIILGSKTTQELAEYTEGTLKKTQEILARIQARRINSK